MERPATRLRAAPDPRPVMLHRLPAGLTLPAGAWVKGPASAARHHAAERGIVSREAAVRSRVARRADEAGNELAAARRSAGRRPEAAAGLHDERVGLGVAGLLLATIAAVALARGIHVNAALALCALALAFVVRAFVR